MKIIEALKDGDLSFVQVKHSHVTVAIQKAGELVAITTKGRGNVRFAKSQAKLIHALLNGFGDHYKALRYAKSPIKGVHSIEVLQE